MQWDIIKIWDDVAFVLNSIALVFQNLQNDDKIILFSAFLIEIGMK